MYIRYNENNYKCTRMRVSKDTRVYIGIPDDFPTEISGSITLMADSGAEMRTDNADEYLYKRVANGILTLTNIPEPIPEEEKPIPENVTADEMANAILEGVNSI